MKTVFIKNFKNATSENELRKLLAIAAKEMDADIDIMAPWELMDCGHGVIEEMAEEAVVNKNSSAYEYGKYSEGKAKWMKGVYILTDEINSSRKDEYKKM